MTNIETLSASELRRLLISSRFVTGMAVFIALGGGGYWLITKPSSVGEYLFGFVVAAGGVVVAALLLRHSHGLRQDIMLQEKVVIRGRIERIDSELQSLGLRWVIWVAGVPACDPLLPPAPDFMSRVSVGSLVEVAHLANARRTLTIKLL
jgi:hypothetical protein